MEKYAFIPTRDGKSNTLDKLREYLTEAGYEVCLLLDKPTIFDAYRDAVNENTISVDDQIIMCHDDLEILSRKDSFNAILDTHFSQPKAGFLGSAGSRVLGTDGIWWNGYNQGHAPKRPDNPMSGTVFHGPNCVDLNADNYGSYGPVVVLDGLFLATTGKVLNSITLRKPKGFVGGWDFYDIYYTFQAHLKGFKNKTAPILLRHESPGTPGGNYHANREAFVSHYRKKLPAII